MFVKVNADCIGCGMCEQICPEVFQLNEKNLSQVAGNPVGKEKEIMQASAVCPVNAIEIS